MRARTIAVLLAFFLLSVRAPARGEDRVLRDFPLEVECGVSSQPPFPAARAGARAVVLPDLPFEPSEGYGYVGGEAGTRGPAVVRGGDESWPLVWREGPRKYSFRVPNGEYLLRLTFLETEAAAPGLRVFDVLAAEGKLLNAVDIVREAGDFAWLSREALTEVREGWLDLGFAPRAGSLPARISRIRLEPAAGVPPSPAAPRGLLAESGPLEVLLRWQPPDSPGIAGYGVFRSESPGGPFESLTALPVAAPRFLDEGLAAGSDFFYRVRAYGVRGGQSPLTAPAAARAAPAPTQGLKVLELKVAEADRMRLGARARLPVEVPGELHAYGAIHAVEVSSPVDEPRWQARKTYSLRVGPGSRHGFMGRHEINLLAEAGDPTLLREKLATDVDRALGLAAPEASHLHLLLNGRYQGIYLDREPLDRMFRQRAGLDRFGMLARIPGRLRLAPGWAPHGETRGSSGDPRTLAYLVQELNRVNQGELESYFEDRFYLDRLIDRLASAALVGVDPELPDAEPPPYFLDDSRNGKWEVFPADRRGGEFGLRDFHRPGETTPDAASARRSLLGFTPYALERPPGAGGSRWRVLETRLLGRPALRERYLTRVEALARDSLTPERLEGLLAAARAPLQVALLADGEGPGAASRDPLLWPADGGAAFREGPAAIAHFYRAHREALLAAVAAERARRPELLQLSEVLLRPREPGASPWLEIRSARDEGIDPGGLFLTDDLDRPRAFHLPAGPGLRAGERLVVVFGTGAAGAGGGPPPVLCPLRPSPDGGELGLFQAGPAGEMRLLDCLIYGRQTAGLSYGRLPEGSADWTFLKEPSPGAPNAGPAASSLPFRFRSGLEVEKSGDYLLWLQVSGSAEAVAGAAVHFLDEASGPYGRSDLSYNRETYRHELRLDAARRDRHPAYYFTATSRDGVERAYPLPGPLTPFRVPQKPALFINEVLPRPTRGGPLEEFVELYNAGEEPIAVDGMFLSDDRKNPMKFRITGTQPIPPKRFLLIYTDGRGEGVHASFRLGNAGEYLGLFHRAEEGGILIDQLAFPAIPVDKSYGRERDGGKGFRVWKDPTPGARNIPRIPPELLKKKDASSPAPGAVTPPPAEARGDAAAPPGDKRGG